MFFRFIFSAQILKRGAAPGGGGEVFFSCPVRQKLRPLQMKDPGKIKRIRGVVYPSYIIVLGFLVSCQ